VSRALRLDITSEPEQLGPVRERVENWTRDHGWGPHDVHDIVLAVDEALTNVIRHGYQGQPGRPIEIHVKPIRDRRLGSGLEIAIRDYGRQVPLESICSRDLDDIRPGGLGVHIIKSVMHDACYAHADGGGTRLTMRKFHRPEGGPGGPAEAGPAS
jgi:anti-sigma regulatory factor (Ser/Thr protein kinase)